MLATTLRILRQLRGDPRTLALILVAPLFVVFLLHEVVVAGQLTPRIAIVNTAAGATTTLSLLSPDAVIQELKKSSTIIEASDAAVALRELRGGTVDAVVDFSATPPEVTVDAADPSTSLASIKAIQEAFSNSVREKAAAFAGPLFSSASPKISFINGSASTSTFDFLAPVLLAFIIFFFTFILSGISFLRERTSGTLERAFATPLSRSSLVGGYMIGFGIIAAVQTILVQLLIVGVYRAPNVGGFGPSLIVSISISLSALAMGLFLSAFANSEFQMLQFIPIVIVPQILFAGIFNLRSGPEWINALSYAFPLTYAGQALRDLMIRGKTLLDVLPNLAAVWGFAVVFIVLAVVGLGKFRRGQS